jgi:hypothetical protein
MKTLWDSENQNMMYAIDESVLHERVIKNNIKVRKMASLSEWTMFFAMFGLALIIIVEGLLDNELYQLPEGIILLGAAVYIYRDRQKRLKIHMHSGNSILDDVEKTIGMLNFHARRQRNFIWWFVTPLTITTVIHAIYTFSGKPWWLWPLSALSFGLSYWAIMREVRQKFLPKKEELESLRDLIITSDVKDNMKD